MSDFGIKFEVDAITNTVTCDYADFQKMMKEIETLNVDLRDTTLVLEAHRQTHATMSTENSELRGTIHAMGLLLKQHENLVSSTQEKPGE